MKKHTPVSDKKSVAKSIDSPVKISKNKNAEDELKKQRGAFKNHA
jgi:hypothetical protein